MWSEPSEAFQIYLLTLLRSTYAGKKTACRFSVFPGFQIYLFQDRNTIRQIFRHPDLRSPVATYTFALSRFFGMPERTMRIYQDDNSGPGTKPHPESNVEANARVIHVTRKGFTQGLTGPGLAPHTRRYTKSLVQDLRCYYGGNLGRVLFSHRPRDWIHLPDLFHFTQHSAGRAMISAHFGPSLLRLYPSYMDDLSVVDRGIPWFARGIPRFLVPKPYRARDRLIQNLMDWYTYAREHYDEGTIDEDGDGDPIWGSALNRYRQKTLLGLKDHDDRAMASLDLGHSWG